MFREDDDFVFQRVTGGLRKPIVRFRVPSGRQIELVGFHLEPACNLVGPIVYDVVRRLYPDEQPVFVGELEKFSGPAWLCCAHLYSDKPVRRDSMSNYSALLICGLVRDIGTGVRGMVCELLSQVDWEAVATDDHMW